MRLPAYLLLFIALVVLSGWALEGPRSEPLGQTEINYFMTVGLGAEYGDSEARIRKWAGDLRIKVSGEPSSEDRKTLEQVVRELNSLQDQVVLVLVDDKPNVEMIFAPEADFGKLEPNYEPTNYGFFWVNWNSGGEIYRARILISTDKVTQEERSHLIREELTQSLGLMRDSIKYPDSIFYASRTETSEYSDIDRTLIKLLYSKAIEANMTQDQVRALLEEARSPE